MFKSLLPIAFACIVLSSCTKKEDTTTASPGSTYFSINGFIADQWKTFKGQPYGITKTVTLNGKTDSMFTSAFELDWSAVMKPFIESDISDPKFLGKYNYTAFKDDATYTINLYYEAKEDNLFTRKLQISIDDLTAKIKSVYIETEDGETTRKLFYIPVKVVSIQEFENMGESNGKELRVEYRFL